MGLGIREPRRRQSSVELQVPGTARLIEKESVSSSSREYGDVVLVPQPSGSPEDPLNWPVWKKDLALLAMCLSITVGGIQDSLLSTVNGVIQSDFNVSILKIENLSSYPLLASGAACLFASVLARMIGKRPIYVLSTGILLVTVVWSACINHNYASFFAARFISGIGLGAYEALVLSSIGDMYFIHQRGKRVAFLNMLSLGPVNLAPVLSGYVADKYGWRTNFWILTAFTAVAFLLVVFVCPETRYHRPLIFETDLGALDGMPVLKETNKSTGMHQPILHQEVNSETPVVARGKSYWQEIKPFTYIDRNSNPIAHLIRLFACMLYPAVIWSFLVGGTYSGWFSGLSITLAQIFSTPPTSYTPTQLGHLNTFPGVGAFSAFAVLSLLADSIAKRTARYNNSIYEPEFRLYLISFGLFIGVPGLALFGYYAGTATAQHEISWVIISFLYGMVIFTTVTQQSTSFAYLLDAHRDISIETAVVVVMVRNFFSFGAGKFLPVWLLHSGTANTFYAIAGLQTGLVLTTIPLYIYGKVIRDFLHRHNPLTTIRAEARPERVPDVEGTRPSHQNMS